MQTQLPRVPEPPARTRGPSAEAGLGTGGCALGLDRPSLNLTATYLPFIGLRSPANTRISPESSPRPHSLGRQVGGARHPGGPLGAVCELRGDSSRSPLCSFFLSLEDFIQ